MNLDKMKEILETPLPSDIKETLIISVIAGDKNVLPTILSILEADREEREELLLDTNLELSRALAILRAKSWGRQKKNREWVMEQIKLHYIKWKDVIKCCIKIDGLP